MIEAPHPLHHTRGLLLISNLIHNYVDSFGCWVGVREKIMATTQTAWFLGAPVSKTIAIATSLVFILAEMNKFHDALILGT